MKFTLFLLCCILSFGANAQSYEYEVLLEPISIPSLGGIHSYAIAQHNGEWLILGGRLDGLHQRQPFAAFDVSAKSIEDIQNIVVKNVDGTPIYIKDIATGFEYISEAIQLEKLVYKSTLVISGEGRLDGQSLHGKVISGINKLSKKHEKPLVIVTGKNELSASELKSCEFKMSIVSQA